MGAHWHDVARIFESAVGRSPAERAEFVRQACLGDSDLRREVESLLAEEHAPVLLDGPIAAAAHAVLGDNPAVSDGTVLGPYRIASLLGVGGMGEVYRARDTKLNRDVAIKILPTAFANDPERLARFKREAQVLAALNHPNIGGIYGLEGREGPDGQEGPPCLVLELVEGPTLADRIARGPVAVDEALSIARQIADALECAHEQGIIHRDLKPANIKVREDGTVKVLDFGLAKIGEAGETGRAAAENVTQSPTITTPAATAAGMILGTAAYMSPEQAKGKPADKRSDIWAFGCVLYEMLTGKRAFNGDDVVDTLAAILRTEPDWSALPPLVPRRVREVLKRCLAKDRSQRFADVADVRFELVSAAHGPADGESNPAHRGHLRVHVAWATVALLLAAAAVVLVVRRAPAAPSETTRFEVEAPSGWDASHDNALGPAAVTSLAVSPDGRQLAFVARNAEGLTRLWIRLLNQLSVTPLPGTDGALGPFWSPDSRQIAFFVNGKIRKIDVSNGTVATVCETSTFNSGTWGRSDVILFSRIGGGAFGRVADGELPSGVLLQVPAAGGTPVAASTMHAGEQVHIRPTFLPDGRHFIFRATAATSNGAMWIGSLDSSERRPLFENTPTGNVVYAKNHLLFMAGTTLMAQPFDLAALRLTGAATPIAEQVATSGIIPPIGSFAASDTGVLAYRTSVGGLGSQLTWFDRTGRRLGTVGERGDYNDLELSPDGTKASISVRTRNGSNRDISIVDLARGAFSRLTTDPATEQKSVWSPDGRRVAFNRDHGPMDVYSVAVGGGGPEEPLLVGGLNRAEERVPLSYSPDGRELLFRVAGRFPANTSLPQQSSGSARGEIWALPLTGTPKPFLFLTVFGVPDARFSPDGRWVAFSAAEDASAEVFIASFPTPAVRIRVSPRGGNHPRWSRDGRELFFIRQDGLWSAQIRSSATGVDVGAVTRLFGVRVSGPQSSYAVAPGGQRFLINLPGDSTQESRNPIVVVLNWSAGLP